MNTLKTTSVLFFLLLCVSANAQFAKGNLLLEGGISFGTDFQIGDGVVDLSTPGNSPNDTEGHSIGTTVALGTFLSPNKELLFTVGYGRARSRTTTLFDSGFGSLIFFENTNTRNDLSLGVDFRRYFPFAARFYGGFSVGANVGHSWFTNKGEFFTGFEPVPQTSKSKLLNAGVSGNLFLSYLFSERFGARMSFGAASFQWTKSDQTDVANASFDVFFNTTISPAISFFWIFNGKSDDRD